MKNILIALLFISVPVVAQTTFIISLTPIPRTTLSPVGANSLSLHAKILRQIGPKMKGEGGYSGWQRSLRLRLEFDGPSADLLTEATKFRTFCVQYKIQPNYTP